MRTSVYLAIQFWVLGPSALAGLSAQPLEVGPYGPRDATSVVHIDMQGLWQSELGKAIAASELGKAGAQFFKDLVGYDWRRIETLRLASVVRPTRLRLRDIWVLHARGHRGLPMPKRLAGFVVDVMAAKKIGAGAMGFAEVAPRELLVGDAEFLRDRLAGQQLKPTPGFADARPKYLLRAVIRTPKIGVAQVGRWTLPLLDGVSYREGGTRAIVVELGPFGPGQGLQLTIDFAFNGSNNQRSASRLQDELMEKIARAQRQRDYFSYWSVLAAITFDQERRSDFRRLRMTLPLTDPRILASALAGYVPVASVVTLLSQQLTAWASFETQAIVETESPEAVLEEAEVEESLTAEEREARRKAVRKGKRRKKRNR